MARGRGHVGHIGHTRHRLMFLRLGPAMVLRPEPKPDRDGKDGDRTETDPNHATTRGRGRFLQICVLHGFTFHGRFLPTACSRAMRAAYASSNMSVYPVSISMEPRCSAMTSSKGSLPALY